MHLLHDPKLKKAKVGQEVFVLPIDKRYRTLMNRLLQAVPLKKGIVRKKGREWVYIDDTNIPGSENKPYLWQRYRIDTGIIDEYGKTGSWIGFSAAFADPNVYYDAVDKAKAVAWLDDTLSRWKDYNRPWDDSPPAVQQLDNAIRELGLSPYKKIERVESERA